MGLGFEGLLIALFKGQRFKHSQHRGAGGRKERDARGRAGNTSPERKGKDWDSKPWSRGEGTLPHHQDGWES